MLLSKDRNLKKLQYNCKYELLMCLLFVCHFISLGKLNLRKRKCLLIYRSAVLTCQNIKSINMQ